MSAQYFDNQEIIAIEETSLPKLKMMAEKAPLRRARYCLHHQSQDLLHEMVIAFCQDSYVRPHKHKNKSESFHMIEGELLVVFFDNHGRVTRFLRMKAKGQDGCFLYRLSSELWHMVIPLTDHVVIHEVTNGPFIKEDSTFAAWSPDGNDKNEALRFMEQVKQDVGQVK
jgi:cupin fold WbuC family metalloprotein